MLLQNVIVKSFVGELRPLVAKYHIFIRVLLTGISGHETIDEQSVKSIFGRLASHTYFSSLSLLFLKKIKYLYTLIINLNLI